MRPIPKQRAAPMVTVHIEGMTAQVPEGDPVAYFAAVYVIDSDHPCYVHITTDKEEAWRKLRVALENTPKSHGHVLAYNILKPKPILIRCIGQIDNLEEQ
ncbi:hypothetical protein [Nonomuraea sp. NPDC049028]|uniref:hypothetical protein n=1 Tax=Nonomuraea sp. NPDC049028 TaxID=3364348 RepID=UPI0037174C19